MVIVLCSDLNSGAVVLFTAVYPPLPLIVLPKAPLSLAVATST
ncbi:hypothetical protein OWR28_11200 [Chryseobacterium sp. 1B4]